MRISNWPGPSMRLLGQVILMGAFQVINFSLVYKAFAGDRLGVLEAVGLVTVNLLGVGVALRPQMPKWLYYLWTAMFLVNLGAVFQGIIKASITYGWDPTLALLVGMPLFFTVSAHLTRQLAGAIKTDRTT